MGRSYRYRSVYIASDWSPIAGDSWVKKARDLSKLKRFFILRKHSNTYFLEGGKLLLSYVIGIAVPSS